MGQIGSISIQLISKQPDSHQGMIVPTILDCYSKQKEEMFGRYTMSVNGYILFLLIYMSSGMVTAWVGDREVGRRDRMLASNSG